MSGLQSEIDSAAGGYHAPRRRNNREHRSCFERGRAVRALFFVFVTRRRVFAAVTAAAVLLSVGQAVAAPDDGLVEVARRPLDAARVRAAVAPELRLTAVEPDA